MQCENERFSIFSVSTWNVDFTCNWKKKKLQNKHHIIVKITFAGGGGGGEEEILDVQQKKP